MSYCSSRRSDGLTLRQRHRSTQLSGSESGASGPLHRPCLLLLEDRPGLVRPPSTRCPSPPEEAVLDPAPDRVGTKEPGQRIRIARVQRRVGRFDRGDACRPPSGSSIARAMWVELPREMQRSRWRSRHARNTGKWCATRHPLSAAPRRSRSVEVAPQGARRARFGPTSRWHGPTEPGRDTGGR